MRQEGSEKQVPTIEWWDEFLLPEGKQNFPGGKLTQNDIFKERITHFV